MTIGFVEVSPRDGLQNEKTLLSVADKLELIDRAVRAGAKRIEVASFVNPKRVPQMAGAEELIAATTSPSSCTLVASARSTPRSLSTSPMVSTPG